MPTYSMQILSILVNNIIDIQSLIISVIIITDMALFISMTHYRLFSNERIISI